MPKSKFRGSSKLNHYGRMRPLTTEEKEDLWGKQQKPIKGVSYIQKTSPYMGARITGDSLGKYMETQMEAFKERYLREEKDSEDFIGDDEETLNEVARRFARYQVNKENKHFKAWLKGESTFRFQGTKFPVLTEHFLNQTQSIKEIVKAEENE